jgi:hypothetical protein
LVGGGVGFVVLGFADVDGLAGVVGGVVAGSGKLVDGVGVGELLGDVCGGRGSPDVHAARSAIKATDAVIRRFVGAPTPRVCQPVRFRPG